MRSATDRIIEIAVLRGFAQARQGVLLLATVTLLLGDGFLRSVHSQRPSRTIAIDSKPMVAIGEIDGPEELQFAFIVAAIALGNGEILIVDRLANELRVFHQGGGFRRRFGGEGSGPSEFKHISDVAVRGDTILVVDPMLGKVAYFDFGGTLLHTVRQGHPGASLVGVGKDGVRWWSWMAGQVSGPAPSLTADSIAIGIGERNVEAVTGAIVRWRFNRSPYPFSPVARPVVYRDSLLVPHPTDGTLRIIDRRGRIRRVIRVPVPATNVADAWRILEREVQRRDALRGRTLSNIPRVAQLPRIASLVIDATDHIWVKRYDPAEDAHWLGGWAGGEGGDWIVLNPDGRAVATVRVPARVTPLFIGHDMLIGRHVGEWDVQRLLIYRVRR